ncbi:MAG: acylphosphatase [Desulfuromonadaceae bacterium]|nr:acylphosphatase [Desulfuromonadaceae bacterium]
MGKIRIRTEISGRVQGVCYRHFTQQSAGAHGVTGWVKNLGNGKVAALFEGEELAVTRVLNECRQGPPAAEVNHMEIVAEEFSGEFDSFTILR